MKRQKRALVVFVLFLAAAECFILRSDVNLAVGIPIALIVLIGLLVALVMLASLFRGVEDAPGGELLYDPANHYWSIMSWVYKKRWGRAIYWCRAFRLTYLLGAIGSAAIGACVLLYFLLVYRGIPGAVVGFVAIGACVLLCRICMKLGARVILSRIIRVVSAPVIAFEWVGNRVMRRCPWSRSVALWLCMCMMVAAFAVSYIIAPLFVIMAEKGGSLGQASLIHALRLALVAVAVTMLVMMARTLNQRGVKMLRWTKKLFARIVMSASSFCPLLVERSSTFRNYPKTN